MNIEQIAEIAKLVGGQGKAQIFIIGGNSTTPAWVEEKKAGKVRMLKASHAPQHVINDKKTVVGVRNAAATTIVVKYLMSGKAKEPDLVQIENELASRAWENPVKIVAAIKENATEIEKAMNIDGISERMDTVLKKMQKPKKKENEITISLSQGEASSIIAVAKKLEAAGAKDKEAHLLKTWGLPSLRTISAPLRAFMRCFGQGAEAAADVAEDVVEATGEAVAAGANIVGNVDAATGIGMSLREAMKVVAAPVAPGAEILGNYFATPLAALEAGASPVAVVESLSSSTGSAEDVSAFLGMVRSGLVRPTEELAEILQIYAGTFERNFGIDAAEVSELAESILMGTLVIA